MGRNGEYVSLAAQVSLRLPSMTGSMEATPIHLVRAWRTVSIVLLRTAAGPQCDVCLQARMPGVGVAAAVVALLIASAAAQYPAPDSLPNPGALRSGPGRGRGIGRGRANGRGPSGGGYQCAGPKCCDYTCDNDSQTCAIAPFAGAWVPKSWLTDDRAESCAVKVRSMLLVGAKPAHPCPAAHNGKCRCCQLVSCCTLRTAWPTGCEARHDCRKDARPDQRC